MTQISPQKNGATVNQKKVKQPDPKIDSMRSNIQTLATAAPVFEVGNEFHVFLLMGSTT